MALLELNERKEYFALLKLGEYNSTNIEKLQKKYLLRKSDVDGIYGTNTDNLLKHLYNCRGLKDFAPEEFRCGCGGRYCSGYPTYMRKVELDNIQAIRSHFGKPMIVTCGVRCTKYNSLVGGIKNSLHLVGLAVDYYIKGVTDTLKNRKRSLEWIKKLPNHNYSYGHGINSNGYYVDAPGMGNALHTDSVKKSPTPTPTPTPDGKLVVDGIGGAATVKRMQEFFDTGIDGVISGQNLNLKKYYPSLISVKSGIGGSPCIKMLQKWIGVTQDGVIGQNTVKAWQKKIGVTADGIFGPASMKKWQTYLNNNKKPTYPPEPTPKKSWKVIDVSEWQGSIDFAKVKADGVVGVIIRYADGTYVDKYFDRNMKSAKAAGLHIGAYIFSRAENKTQAEKEATRIFNACKKYSPDMPLYIDLEDASLSKAADANAQAFIKKIEALGGVAGVYANVTWWNNYLKATAELNKPMWVAQYYKECQYKPLSRVGMWQYSSSGSVKGISGRVDMNHCYVEYWKKSSPSDDGYNAEVGEKICAWCKKIAESGKYSYKVYTDDPDTHKCPICHPGSGDGWNCIGYSWASWRHGAGIPCKCNCEIINDSRGTKMLQMSVAEATKMVQERSGIKDIKVIIKKGGIPASDLRKGDIILYYDGNEYTHSLVYVGDSKVSDCGRGNNPNIKYGKKYSQKECKVAIRYTGKTPDTKKGYQGDFPSYKLVKTTAQVIADAIKWAKWIAGYNTFHYGHGKHAHHNGCFFCGTQKLKKGHGIKDWQYTYCCNPFVGAAWAHGGGDATAWKLCHDCNSWGFLKNDTPSYEKSKLFDKVSLNALKLGDVLCSDSHVALYIGNGKVVQAGHEDDNKVGSKSWNSSISIDTWKGYKRAYRYKGSVNAYRPLSHGEVSDRVADLQRFLTWYGAKLTVDGIFGDDTLKAVKAFQKAQKLDVDGWVGEKTIKAMKAVKK